MDHKKLVEAALFMSQSSLDLQDLAKITGMSSLGLLKEIVEELEKEYSDRGLEIISKDGQWRMQVRPELLPTVASLTPHQDLPEGHKRTLALIVYKEPVKQSEIIKTQGTKAYAYIKQLRKRGLVKGEKEGHTRILTSTKELENYFGMSRKEIKEQLTIVEEPVSLKDPQKKLTDTSEE